MSFNEANANGIYRTVKLKEISFVIKTGKTPPAHVREYMSEGNNFIGSKSVFDGYIDKSTFLHLNDESMPYLESNSLHEEDVLLNVTGDGITFGRNAMVTKDILPAYFSQNIAVIRLNKLMVHPKYISYYLNMPMMKEYINNHSSGSARRAIPAKNIKELEVRIPDLNIQTTVANILSSLDEKIEVNNQINKKLEEMAQAIFKQWFVDFEFPNEEGNPYKSSGGAMVESELGMIPEGWEVKTLDDITSKFATGLNPRKNFVLGQGENFYVTIKNMNNHKVILDEKCDKVDDDAIQKINNRSDLLKGDLLFSGIGTIGRVYLIDKTPINWNISESIFTLRAIPSVSPEFLYLHLLSPYLQGYATQLASGSVQKGIRMADLKKYKLVLPTKKVHDIFTLPIKSIINKIKSNDNENIELTKTRKLLLPKLMSGEIRVPIDQERFCIEERWK